MQPSSQSSPQPAYWSYDNLRQHFRSASQNLQLKLDIARVSKEIHHTQALLSRLKVMHALLMARSLLHEADSETLEAMSSKTEIGRLRQSMVDAGVAIQPTRPNDEGLLEALARLDTEGALTQASTASTTLCS
ncbi:hypothetical protein BJ138DRAFT_1119298 [Hygrophoropsis aurantiaca]|uniref:Uncharacterized protein n=1 Tax=Hygrophoropsis aurantiaca TaxID=72124 RepID=A0ACB7ZV02_9AGAM|nr:hypothetical protein BJ138DRAFT_1119298 [Hygrophoropsis aurantiaca]